MTKEMRSSQVAFSNSVYPSNRKQMSFKKFQNQRFVRRHLECVNNAAPRRQELVNEAVRARNALLPMSNSQEAPGAPPQIIADAFDCPP